MARVTIWKPWRGHNAAVLAVQSRTSAGATNNLAPAPPQRVLPVAAPPPEPECAPFGRPPVMRAAVPPLPMPVSATRKRLLALLRGLRRARAEVPPMADVAAQLGLQVSTVNMALSRLERDGLVRRRMGDEGRELWIDGVRLVRAAWGAR